MKTKEEILKRYGDKIREAIYQQELKPVYRPVFTNEIQNILYEAITKTREETLKEIIREYQDNELDGKGYDFYFSIRAKIDELNKLKK